MLSRMNQLSLDSLLLAESGLEKDSEKGLKLMVKMRIYLVILIFSGHFVVISRSVIKRLW